MDRGYVIFCGAQLRYAEDEDDNGDSGGIIVVVVFVLLDDDDDDDRPLIALAVQHGLIQNGILFAVANDIAISVAAPQACNETTNWILFGS